MDEQHRLTLTYFLDPYPDPDPREGYERFGGSLPGRLPELSFGLAILRFGHFPLLLRVLPALLAALGQGTGGRIRREPCLLQFGGVGNLRVGPLQE